MKNIIYLSSSAFYNLLIKKYKLYCVKSNKYITFKNPKISCTFRKILVVLIIFDKCNNNYEKTFKEEQSIQILKILGLINNINGYYIYCT